MYVKIETILSSVVRNKDGDIEIKQIAVSGPASIMDRQITLVLGYWECKALARVLES